MSPKKHFIYAIIISIIMYPFVGLKVLYFIIGAVLVDIDHYLYYAAKYRQFSIFKLYRYWMKHENRLAKESICIFHTVEFIAIMVILSFFSLKVLWITIGLLFHTVVDLYNEFLIIKFGKNYSLFNYIRRKIS